MAHDPLIGRKLGDYTILRLLGRGGMSRVYVGYDENLDRYAAVKVISGDASTMDEAEYARRFQAEARAIARLRHPNIVGIYQFGRSRGIYYMAQVLLEGADLRALLRGYAERNLRMPPAEIVRVVRDVADALDYAHEQGVIHRDVKPSNIMLERRTGRAILMDFGLALSVPEGTLGDTFGSAHYIAPEQAISSARAVPQSDLYSLGVVVYEMATGTVPFDDPSVMNVALKHLNEPPPPPSLHNPDLPSAVEQVILRALEKDPARRFRTGAAFADALARAFADAPARLSQGPTIAEMLRWQATAREPSPPPAEVAPPPPRPSTPSRPRHTPLPTPASGVAARFAQHRQEKEAEEALRAIEDGELLLDDEALEDLLQSYGPESQAGSTGSATASAQPAQTAAAPAQAEAAPTSSRRRSRVRLLLLLLIALAVAAGVFALKGQQGDQESKAGVPAAQVASPTETAQTSTATPTPASTATRQAPLTPTAPGTGTVVPAVGADRVSATPTRTAAPSFTPTGTPTLTQTPSATVTTSPTPSVTPTTLPSPTAGPPPTLRLLYTPDALLLINVSGAALDVSGLVFEQTREDGSDRLFRATAWDREGMADRPAQMRSGGCYQLVTQSATQTQPDRSICPEFLGYVRLDSLRRYFWEGGDAETTFTVRLADQSAPLGICLVAAGECGIYLAAPAATPTPTPSRTPTRTPTPTATPTPAPDVRLLYDREAVLLINVSGTTLDISALVFEQTLPDGRVLTFEAALWNRPEMAQPPAQMPSGGCYQAVTGEGTQMAPAPSVCEHFLGWFRTSAPSRYFWLSDDPAAVFTVRRANESAPLATCPIAAGECSFSLGGRP
jgi:serine/threonine protein kinase